MGWNGKHDLSLKRMAKHTFKVESFPRHQLDKKGRKRNERGKV